MSDYEYDDYRDPDAYNDDAPRHGARRPGSDLVQQAFDLGITGSIIATVLLTVLYAFLPVDAVPDFIPLAGQIDDIAAILAGGSSVTFLAVLRFVMRSRVARVSCLVVIVLSAIGAFAVFWVLMRIFNSLV